MSRRYWRPGDLSVRRSERTLLENIDLRIESGAFLGILGPNGSGKTTLLRTFTGAMEPSEGVVLLEGRPVSSYDRRSLARRLGVVPQTFTLDFRFTVEEVVALGRYPHRASWGQSDSKSDAVVGAALEALSITELSDRPVTELSGGERQRVLIAQTLAQDTPVLLFDEPLNNLDLNHQLEVMQVLARLNSEGRTVIVVVHDINMAAQYCADLLMLRGGRVAAHGTPDELLTPETLLEVFSTRVTVHRQGGRPYVTPLTASPGGIAHGAVGFRVHVVTGGGAGVHLTEELTRLGFSPSLGVVSVFDSDYQAAQELGLTVISAPPFQRLSAESIREHQELIHDADCVVLAPQVYGDGNLADLDVARVALESGSTVIVVTEPPVESRDLTGGAATALQTRLLEAGATAVPDAHSAVMRVSALAAHAAVHGATHDATHEAADTAAQDAADAADAPPSAAHGAAHDSKDG